MQTTCVSLVGLFCATMLCGAAQAADRVALAEKYLQAWYDTGRFNGSVLIARGDEVLLEKGYGYANREWQVPNGPDTKFNIGSVSKQFTAVMVFQLAEEGKLTLDDKLTQHLPDYRKDTGEKVTLDPLLQHTSGIPCFLHEFKPQAGKQLQFPLNVHLKRDAMIRDYMSGNLLFEPGARYKYSNSGYILLAQIIERLTQKSFAENLRTRILLPLDLRDTGLIEHGEVVEKMAAGYAKVPGGFLQAGYRFAPNLTGTGGMYSTVRDLFQWNRAIDSERLLSKESWAKIKTPYWKQNPGEQYAYNLTYFAIGTREGGEPLRYTSFSGATNGFCTDAFRFGATGHTIVVLDNSEQYNHWQIAPGVYRILTGGAPRWPKPKAVDLVARALAEKGEASAVACYRNLVENHSGQYEFAGLESEINKFGYKNLYINRFPEAVRILQLNTALFPDSANTHDSLGDAYTEMGRTDRAQGCYAKAKAIAGREDTLLEMIEAGEFARAEQKIGEIRQTTPESQLFTPRRIGPLFGRTFAAGQNEKALQICRLWQLGSPKARGPLFSMARVYVKMGKKSEAIGCYQQVLEMEPQGSGAEAAKRAIEELRSGPNTVD
ncbi:MAG: serine hydrolase [Sedimentisphaerales bacterium]|nr:serine hydrolase [Sedimentisphaerales bacterium]